MSSRSCSGYGLQLLPGHRSRCRGCRISIIAVGDSPAAIGTLLSFKKTVGIHMDPFPSMITRSPARSRALAAVLNFPGRDSNVCRVIRYPYHPLVQKTYCPLRGRAKYSPAYVGAERGLYSLCSSSHALVFVCSAFQT